MLRKKLSVVISSVVALGIMLPLFTACGTGSEQKPAATSNEEKKAEKNTTGSGKKYVFKLSHHLALDHPVHKAGEEFAKLAKEKSNGRIEVQQYGGGQLGGLKDNCDAIRYGTIDMAWIDLGTVGTMYPKAAVIGLPFLFRDYDHVHKFFDGEIGQKLTEDIVKATGVRFLQYSDSGFRSIVSKKPISTPDDMKGMKIRVPEMPVYVQTMKALGANPTPIPMGEVYTALQTGVVDAMECPSDTLYISKVQEVTKNIVRTRHIYTDLDLAINDKLYQSLPDDIKKALDAAAMEAVKNHRKYTVENDDGFFKKLVDSGLKESTPNIDEFKSKVKGVWEDFAKQADARDLIDAISAIK